MAKEEKKDVYFFEQLTRRNIRKNAVNIAKAALSLMLKAEEEEPISLEETLDDIVENTETASEFIQTLREIYEDEND